MSSNYEVASCKVCRWEIGFSLWQVNLLDTKIIEQTLLEDHLFALRSQGQNAQRASTQHIKMMKLECFKDTP